MVHSLRILAARALPRDAKFPFDTQCRSIYEHIKKEVDKVNKDTLETAERHKKVKRRMADRVNVAALTPESETACADLQDAEFHAHAAIDDIRDPETDISPDWVAYCDIMYRSVVCSGTTEYMISHPEVPTTATMCRGIVASYPDLPRPSSHPAFEVNELVTALQDYKAIAEGFLRLYDAYDHKDMMQKLSKDIHKERVLNDRLTDLFYESAYLELALHKVTFSKPHGSDIPPFVLNSLHANV